MPHQCSGCTEISTMSNQACTISEHAFEFTNIHKSFSTPCLSHSSRVKDDYDTNSRIEIIVGHAAPRVRALVAEVAIAMASGVNPEPMSSGLGGAYFLRAQNGDTIAVAKPIDEEPLAVNNPKGLAGRMLGQPGMKCSIRIGETGLRESAAYFLDHDGFAGVPPTALVRFSHVKFNLSNSESDSTQVYKIASLQRFVNHDSDVGDLGPSSFSVTSVHHIAELVPIDHGFCLPESLDDPYFEWLHWPQASIPFSESEVDYISRLNPYKDAELLRTELPSIAEEFRGGEENWSTLENLCMNVKASLKNRVIDGSQNYNQPEEEVDEMFQFDDEHEDDLNQVSPTKGKPSKIPRFSSMSVLDDLNKNEQYLINDCALNSILTIV
ncbi:hypothetical protein DH2020_045812 [Rehmannia glutinosa]|uniref:1-phosphatidylinositol 4-kinase n=1 Tax=Rehmannia glutinosa TaxID=99300 RepID=A0ABR0UD30_REHGL